MSGIASTLPRARAAYAAGLRWLAARFEIAHGSNATIRPMEGLRGIAVSLVFLVHYSTLVSPWIEGATRSVAAVVHAFGHLGVDLFFVLSGFLIYGTIISRSRFDAGHYAYRRVKRIYPTFLAVLSIYLVLSVLFPSESKFPQGVAASAVYLAQNLMLLPGMFDIEPIITVAWSLSYEAFYYLVIPPAILLLRMRRWRPTVRIAFWSAIGFSGFFLLPAYGGPVRAMMFLAGIVVYELYSASTLRPRHGGTAALIAALAVFGAGGLVPIHYPTAFSIVAVLFGWLCLVSFRGDTFAARWLAWTPLRWLGNMSYSYYLIHGLTLKFCFLVLPTVFPPTTAGYFVYYWLWLPMFAATLVVSAGLYLTVERPLSLKKRPKPGATRPAAQRP